MGLGFSLFPLRPSIGAAPKPARLAPAMPGEGVFAYLRRTGRGRDQDLYRWILGAANEFKEGDQIVGIAALNEGERREARRLLAATRIADLNKRPVFGDRFYDFITKDPGANAVQSPAEMTLGDLKAFLLHREEPDVKSLAAGLSSDVIGCVVKLMSNEELIAVGAKVFHPLPGSQIGAKGYLGARIQPNSPTDHVEDIRWQVLDGWAYAVGDVVLGTNPVSSDPKSVAAVEETLKDLLKTFGLEDVLPHCVLSHIDVQAKVEEQHPGSTAIWFQSIAGCDTANATFDINLKKMLDYTRRRKGRYGLYFETGQGADFTNGHAHGFDMVLHESRKYGWARSLKRVLAETLKEARAPLSPGCI